MILAFPLTPPLPTGTITQTEACRWLTELTGKAHGVAAALRDYPVFLSVRAPEPARVKALLARALAGRWEQDGRTLRLVPVPLVKGEESAAFAARWQASTAGRGALVSLPAALVETLPVGTILMLGTSNDPVAVPLPKNAAAALRREARGEPLLYVRREAAGRFEASLFAEAEGRRRIVSPSQRIEFDDVPAPIQGRLGTAWDRPAFLDVAWPSPWRDDYSVAMRRFDWRATDRVDPLAAFADPLLQSVARAMGGDVAVAVPDLLLSIGWEPAAPTLGQVVEALGTMVDLSLEDAALVGRLPVLERRAGTQTRRNTLAAIAARARATRTLNLGDLTAFFDLQRPAATEAKSDLAMLSLMDIGFGETRWGDMPYSALLAAALPPEAWRRLRARGAIRVVDLPPAARGAVEAMLAHSRERVLGDADPVRWPGFATGHLSLRADMVDDRIVIAEGPDAPWGSDAHGMGTYHEAWARKIGREPRYAWADRHAIWFTIGPESGAEMWRTRFTDLEADPGVGMGSWRGLPPDLAAEFERGLSTHRRGGQFGSESRRRG